MSHSVRVCSIDLERGWRGGENQVALLQRGLRELAPDIHSTVLARAGEPLAQHLTTHGHAVLAATGSWQAYRLLRRAVKAGEFDIIHAHTGRSHNLALTATRGTDVPVVVTRRVDFELRNTARARRKYGPRVTRVVAISQAIADILARGGVERERITLIPSGVDPERVAVAPSDLRGELGLPADTPIVLCAAALVAHKGHRHLLDAWKVVSEQHPSAVLVLAGTGELEADLRAQAAQLKLPRLHFLGWRDDLPGLLQTCDVFALASVEEGLGTALIDAAFAKVPIAASAAGGIPEIVSHNQTGLLAPVSDSQALATAIGQLLGDRTRAAELTEAAFTQAGQRFHYRAMAQAYVNLYRELAVQ